jgi:hypothetical protein
MVGFLRLAVAGVVLVLLVRAARVAWHNRRLAVAVWRRIRARHVLGSAGLLAVVLSVALALLELVPLTGVGLGTFVGLSSNAVFAPLEEASIRAGGAGLAGGTAAGADPAAGLGAVLVVVATCAFLLGLLGLFPWLAYVEERTFREGLETASPLRELLAALRFGLVHMVMLIPLAAALAIAVAGFAYGRIYRRAHRTAAANTEVVEGPLGAVQVRVSPARARGEAVLESTVWHATFNSLIVVLVLAGFVAQWTGWL